MMNENYIYFSENLQSLLGDYCNKFIVIKDKAVIAAYDSFDEAYVETVKTEKLGTFIIQHCTPNALEPAYRFAWSNVEFTTL